MPLVHTLTVVSEKLAARVADGQKASGASAARTDRPTHADSLPPWFSSSTTSHRSSAAVRNSTPLGSFSPVPVNDLPASTSSSL